MFQHGLAYRPWKTATPEAIRQILGHSRVATTLKDGKPTEDDLRAALEDAIRIWSGEDACMANEEHLAILRRGVRVWNNWRAEHPNAKPDLQEVQLPRINLIEANLTWTIFKNCELSHADLRGANLRGADLRGANLRGANLQEAILSRTNLNRTSLTQAILTQVTLSAATAGHTTFDNLDLRTVHHLETIGHRGPSTIGIDTLYRSQGQIPENFLRGCGVPDSMIEYARSLVAAQRPIDYYSVFISYSSTDEAIAQRLHADLQARGVRCWFAPHNLEIGASIVRGIDEAIRIYDKLLIILSEAAVTSRWVAFEVSTALHREVEHGRTMLFPIRLDDTVLHTPSGWPAQLRTRHIGDFRSWKDHDRYQAAFTRLLRDLTAKEEGER